MNTKYAASLSLAFMGIGFVLTLLLPENTAVFLLRGGFEAGLVGGAADWFAVTALFRHPFGIPIPHTSLLIRNREKMVEALVSAMENELLNKRSIEEILRKHQVLGAASKELNRLVRKKNIRVAAVDFLIGQLLRIPEEQVARLLQERIPGMIMSSDSKGLARSVMGPVLQSGMERKLLDYGLNEALDWVKRKETRYLLGRLANEKMTGIKVGGFMGFAVQAFAGFMDEDKLGSILQDMLWSAIRQLQAPEDPNREKLLRELRAQAERFLEDGARTESFKESAAEWFRSRQAGELLRNGFQGVRNAIADWLVKDRDTGGRSVLRVYRFIYRRIRSDPELPRMLDNRITEYILDLVEANYYRIGRLVRQNLERLDDATLVRLVEEKMGKDLQWIRVNGAICGFAVGLLLSVVQLWHG